MLTVRVTFYHTMVNVKVNISICLSATISQLKCSVNLHYIEQKQLYLSILSFGVKQMYFQKMQKISKLKHVL